MTTIRSNRAARRRYAREAELRAAEAERQPQWDDWKCYRCGSMRPSSEERGGYHTTEAGFSFPFCSACAS